MPSGCEIVVARVTAEMRNTWPRVCGNENEIHGYKCVICGSGQEIALGGFPYSISLLRLIDGGILRRCDILV